MRAPGIRGRQQLRRTQAPLKGRESQPQLLFRANIGDRIDPDPSEVAEFNRLLTDDPVGLASTVDSLRTGESSDDKDTTAYSGAVVRLAMSPHWANGRLAVDETTTTRYLEHPDTKRLLRRIGMGAVEAETAEHAGAKLELRLTMLATLATRTAAAASLDSLAQQGIVYANPGVPQAA